MTSKKINAGVIGAGRIGKLHTKHLAYHIPEVNVSTIADVIFDSAKQCAEECGIPKAVQDYREILEDNTIEAVFICSSTDTHSQIICESAEAGKHIFCEKPIDFDLDRIDNALETVENAGVKLQIGFNRRFDPSFKQAKNFVAEGKIGVPHIVRITSRDPLPPPIEYVKVSGGIFLDMTIHDFDMSRYLIEDDITEIYAVGGTLVDPEIGKAGDIDTAVITLNYQGGAFCTIDNSRKAVYGYDQRVEVFGSEGCIVVGNRTPNAVNLSTIDGVRKELPLFFFIERYTESYIAEIREFVKCVIEDTMPSVTGRDAKIPVVMGLTALKSLKEHRPIKIST